MSIFYAYLKGFCMGIADVIPGVSGGTIAFILGIYEEMIKAIRGFDVRFAGLIFKGRFKEAFDRINLRFLGPLLLGIGSAIIFFSKIVSWLLVNHPVLVKAFFFGLMAATVPIIGRAIKNWNFLKISALAVSAVCTFFLVQMVPLNTPDTWWFIFFCGALSICAMILPGISGAFILLLLGKYLFILEAIHQREVGILLIFISGLIVGLLSFVRILGWVLKRHHDMAIAVLTGIVAGSMNKIWPWKEVVRTITTDKGNIIPVQAINILPGVLDSHFAFAVALLLAGCLAAFLLNKIPKRS